MTLCLALNLLLAKRLFGVVFCYGWSCLFVCVVYKCNVNAKLAKQMFTFVSGTVVIVAAAVIKYPLKQTKRYKS